jgi:catechol 2,3-dioxygenase-like lactoylglutathione lyase family enzyme
VRLDHIAYRVIDRAKAVDFFEKALGYKIDPDLEEGFDIQFEDGTSARCFAMIPPENRGDTTWRKESPWPSSSSFHIPPEIFVSEGTDSSIVAEWVLKNGPGIHHLAYEVRSVKDTMEEWKKMGIEFLSDQPLTCPGLVQVFTKPHPVTGMIYELIERTDKGFCKDNVKNLMNSTKK